MDKDRTLTKANSTNIRRFMINSFAGLSGEDVRSITATRSVGTPNIIFPIWNKK
ncbi:MAG: hypothetical protein JRC56_01785 [Deltaproteobacteria bacterium]|nr:hypothetical protein [Deltaproteobacteria bacterium]MBW2620049.1 hypothetical protein [Deltaproteobacteria bacterium]